MNLQNNNLQIFGKEHLKVNEDTKTEIIKRYNCHTDLLEALQACLEEINQINRAKGNLVFTPIERNAQAAINKATS